VVTAQQGLWPGSERSKAKAGGSGPGFGHVINFSDRKRSNIFSVTTTTHGHINVASTHTTTTFFSSPFLFNHDFRERSVSAPTTCMNTQIMTTLSVFILASLGGTLTQPNGSFILFLRSSISGASVYAFHEI
jgi:hypothetical protein